MSKMVARKGSELDHNSTKDNRKRIKDKRKKLRKPKKIWSQDEDELLLNLIEKYGPSKWSIIASFMTNRQGK